MKKLSDMTTGQKGMIIYLPYGWEDDGLLLKRYEDVTVILNILGNTIAKTESGIKVFPKYIASQITCR